ncbi:MAG: glycosyltransferase family 1 protein [Desulfovibrio sp.]|nr:MAG: glycosyltransferase family 1 protein [Desulfovibrio sp.]
MNILLINQYYLSDALRHMGHRVEVFFPPETSNPGPHPESLSLEQIVRDKDFIPDLVVVGLMGYRHFVHGLEDCPYPLAAVATDAPLNMFWLAQYLRLFDWVFVDQKDSRDHLLDQGIPAQWLPLSVSRYLVAPPFARPKEHGITFVGHVDEQRLKRQWLLNQVDQHFPLTREGGQGQSRMSVPAMLDLFARSKIVLNEVMFPGMTLRVLQGLASGSLVLAEDRGNGLSDLFTDGEHLALFTPETLRPKAAYYLAHDQERERVAAQGREEVLKHHLSEHRAQTLLKHIAHNPPCRANLPERLANAALAYLHVSQRYPMHEQRLRTMSRRAALRAMEALGTLNGHGDLVRGLACSVLGRLHLDEEQVEHAQHLLTETALLLRSDPLPLLTLARIAENRGHSRQAATLYVSALQRLGQGQTVDLAADLARSGEFGPKLWLAVGNVLLERGKVRDPGFIKARDEEYPSSAEEWFALAARGDSGLEPILALGKSARISGQDDQAALCFARVLEMDPTLHEAALLGSAAAKAAYNPDLARVMQMRALSGLRHEPQHLGQAASL